MAKQFLTLMADLDGAAQARLSAWQGVLADAGFVGTQTPGLPYHISLATFSPEREAEAAELARRVAGSFEAFPVHFSHIGLFAGGRVLFCGPERNPALDALHDACDPYPDPKRPWTPHTTLLIDAPERVCAALPVLVEAFRPFVADVVRLHLCAYWPTREIAGVGLFTGRRG